MIIPQQTLHCMVGIGSENVNKPHKILIMFIVGIARDLQVLIDGESGSIATIGQNLTFVCRVQSLFHRWRIPKFNVTDYLVRYTQERNIGASYTTRVVSASNTSLVTSFSIQTTSVINESLIVCEDGLLRSNIENETAMIRVIGKWCVISLPHYQQHVY